MSKWRDKFEEMLDDQPILFVLLCLVGFLLLLMCLKWNEPGNNLVGLFCGFILGVGTFYSLVMFTIPEEAVPSPPPPAEKGGKK